MARSSVVLLGVMLLVDSGCTQGLDARSFQSRAVSSVEAAALFEQGVVIMRREFRRVSFDRENLSITVAPHRYTEARGSGTASGLLGVPSTMRRSAFMRVRRRGTIAVAELRIDIEREDTRRRPVFQQASRLTDLPSYTPIQREAATTERQNTVWTLVRRDRRLERDLLNELRDWASSLADANVGTANSPISP